MINFHRYMTQHCTYMVDAFLSQVIGEKIKKDSIVQNKVILQWVDGPQARDRV